MEVSARLTIFEGPDGGGKTTLAREFAQTTGAKYVHLGPFSGLRRGLPRVHTEAILPALLGYQDVVLDRAWPSERIYGEVFRGGKDRFGTAYRRMWERLALRCETLQVLCLPGEDSCVETFRSRLEIEMLERDDQLREVYRLYDDPVGPLQGRSALPTLRYDYHTANIGDVIEAPRTLAHRLGWGSAGQLDAPVVLVGDVLPELRDSDPLFRAPFVTFDKGGCSAWLAGVLEDHGVPEDRLLWVNADDPELRSVIDACHRTSVVALGVRACATLARFVPDEKLIAVDHPQHAKRLRSREPYELVTVLQEVLT